MKNLIINNNVFNILVQTVPSAWPNQGRIEFQNVYLKYAPDEAPVLKNLNITIESGWKVTRLTLKKYGTIMFLFLIFMCLIGGYRWKNWSW